MFWLDKVKVVLEVYFGGQVLGGVIVDIFFGSVNLSGKLVEIFFEKLIYNLLYFNFFGDGEIVEYWEGIFMGYCYYDIRDVEFLFLFGFGLSYI